MMSNVAKCGQAVYGLKTELAPNREQVTFFERCAGAARFAWNWGLAKRQEVEVAKDCIETLKIPSAIDLHRWLVREKRGELAWLYDLPKDVPQEAFRDLDHAYKNLYEAHMGKPKFKSKRWAKKSFTVSGEKVKVADNAIRLPRIGWIRLKERGYLLCEGAVHIGSATISECVGRWFVSLIVVEDVSPVQPSKDAPVVGIDFNVGDPEHFAILSDGSSIKAPQPLRKNLRRLQRLQRRAFEKQDGSKRQEKALGRAARLHFKIANIRKDFIEKTTTELAKHKRVYVVEDLNVAGMSSKRRHLGRAFLDVSIGRTIERLEQKAPWYGSEVIKADRFYSSTKRCSNCGNVKETMSLSQRWYSCELCGFKANRDYNAAWNLQQWPLVRRTLETGATILQSSASINNGRRDERPICP